MNTHKLPFSTHSYELIVFGIVIMTVLVLLSTIKETSGQRAFQDPRIFGGPERRLYNGVPSKLPLKFEMRNVTSKTWAHDLEIEITNTSDKPIYFMDMYITMPGVKDKQTGYRIGFWLKYGRIELIDFDEPVKPDDVPIRPGEKHTFKISESDAKGWDARRRKEGLADSSILELEFQLLNFGDGTGFRTTSAQPVDIHKKVGSNRQYGGRAGKPSTNEKICFLTT